MELSLKKALGESVSRLIIQHIDTLHVVIKLSMYVGLHDVYPAMNVNFTFSREVKMTAACIFISLEKKCVNY